MRPRLLLGIVVTALSATASPSPAYHLEVYALGNGLVIDQPLPILGLPLSLKHAADCLVSVGNDCQGGNCTANAAVPGMPEPVGSSPYRGVCTNGGTCAVNIGICNGGSCTFNAGDCSNGDDSSICYHAVCDNSRPGEDSEGYIGYICRFDGGNESSGVVFNDPTKEFGVMQSGPWTVMVSDPTTNTVADVSIVCTMQTGGAAYGLGGVSRTSTTQGNTGVLVDTISFNRAPGASSWLCTTVEWSSTKGHSVVIYDADNDTSNGYQCVEYTYSN